MNSGFSSFVLFVYQNGPWIMLDLSKFMGFYWPFKWGAVTVMVYRRASELSVKIWMYTSHKQTWWSYHCTTLVQSEQKVPLSFPYGKIGGLSEAASKTEWFSKWLPKVGYFLSASVVQVLIPLLVQPHKYLLVVSFLCMLHSQLYIFSYSI